MELGDAGDLLNELEGIRRDIALQELEHAHTLHRVAPAHRSSAGNLIHYLALRRHDIRPLQTHLAMLGLSSLGRAEAHVLPTLDAVIRALKALLSSDDLKFEPGISVGFQAGLTRLEENTICLLGPVPDGRNVRIMVTMPTEAATDYAFVRDLLKCGMNCMRINTAHDDETIWAAMIDNLDRAKAEIGLPCEVLLDLAGPKIRTGPLQMLPGAVKWKPQRRDAAGRKFAELLIVPAGKQVLDSAGFDAMLPLNSETTATFQPGDVLSWDDSDGGSGTLEIVEPAGEGWLAVTHERGTLKQSQRLAVNRPGTAGEPGFDTPAMFVEVGAIEPEGVPVAIAPGDLLLLRNDGGCARNAIVDADGEVLEIAAISCLPSKALEYVQPGDRVLFDDGKIGSVAVRCTDDGLVVRISYTKGKKARLRDEKGINFPDSEIMLSGLTEFDCSILPFAAQRAQMIGMSFVQSAQDISTIQGNLAQLGASHLGLVLKIETPRAFTNLPNLLLAGMESPRLGVMIARGDLAVEGGFVRLAELQEEILWVCEAAHVPVIWATQVLETMAQTGTPSRAEITDAAMGVRAECVMLNKGPHILEAVSALADILQRMQDHQSKKRSLLRSLRSFGD